VLGLIEADNAPSGKLDPGDRTPAFFVHVGTLDALFSECGDLGF
jgi:hypothetical protein